MKQKSYITAALAILAMLGFLAVMAVLVMHEIPVSNREFFNTGLIALVGFVSTAFGYYLGSSFGSARKTELLGPLDAPALASSAAMQSRQLGEGGFARFSLLLVLLTVAFLFAICTLTGCSTMKKESPDILAGKSLLAMKATIITAATTGDQLCKKGVIPKADCRTLADWYLKAQPAYDLAADSMTLVLLSRDKAVWQRYQADQAPFRRIFDDVVVMSGRYGLLGGAQ